MKKYLVYLEIMGTPQLVGSIYGNGFRDAVFQYSRDYITSENSLPISVSLPFSENPFSTEETKCFFEGLLPEGFSRKSVANWIKTDEEDYLSILQALGRECLGALMIVKEGDVLQESGYKLLTLDKVKELASEGATKSTQILMETHLSLAGASGKVGLYFDDDNNKWYLPEGKAPSNYIVKQSHVRLSGIVLNEELCMLTAKELGIDTPKSFIINTGKGKEYEVLFATNRYDRVTSSEKRIKGLKVPFRLHQEDFAQAMGISSNQKYETKKNGYLSRMFEIIREYTTNPIAEQMKLWRILCFNYLIGNGDAHVKNYSLLYSENLKRITVAPAYDIVCTRCYNLRDEMSMFIGNEIYFKNIKRATFIEAAKEAGLTGNVALRIFDEVADGFETALEKASENLEETGIAGVCELKNKILEYSGYKNI